jgi:hypothetical protein
MKIVDQIYHCQIPSQAFGAWHNGQATDSKWIEIAPETAQALVSEDLLPV